MKRFKLAAVAAATLLAAGFANAGVLQVVPTSYAAETIPAAGANAPGFSYSLNAPINYLSAVKFTMEFKLDTALWAAAPPAGAFTMTDPNTGNFVTSSSVALNPAGDTVIATFDSTATTGTGGLNSTVAWAVNGVNGKLFPANSVISITTTPQIKLSTTTVFNECAPVAVTIKIAATMKDGLGNQTNETNGNLGSLANQSGPYVSINQGVITTMDSVAGELSKIDVLTAGVAGSAFSAPGGVDATAGTNRIQIGRLTFANNGPLADAGSAGLPYTVATTFGAVGTAAAAAGNVSFSGANLKIAGSFSTALGSFVGLYKDAACTTQVSATTVGIVPTATLATIPMIATDIVALASAAPTAYVCYTVAAVAGNVIPASSFTLDPSSVITRDVTESQANTKICAKPMFVLGLNGVRIDVRNFVTKGSPAYTAGWRSFLRVINTDEAVTTSVRAAVIQNGGLVLADAPLVTLAPRAYQQFSSDDFTNAEAINSRIRLTAASASLRVQSFLYNPANGFFTEVSGSQGDEYLKPDTDLFNR